MKYKIEISGGLAGINRIFEGELSEQSKILQKALITEKNIMKVNPKLRDGFIYNITLQNRKKNYEFIFDETNLTNSLKELVSIAQHQKVA